MNETLQMVNECLSRKERLDREEVVFCNILKHQLEEANRLAPPYFKLLDTIWEKAMR